MATAIVVMAMAVAMTEDAADYLCLLLYLSHYLSLSRPHSLSSFLSLALPLSLSSSVSLSPYISLSLSLSLT